MVNEQIQLLDELKRVVEIFVNSECELRPHFILTGASGSGKSHIISALAKELEVGFLEINAAQLTKEGTAGNSLSKAMTPITHFQDKPTICFVDEFDKLFISGNSNSDLAHETTNGVQNEFLKVLEADTASVYGDYGKYINISTKNVLFVFAGAFNGEENITLDRLREMGIKTEFLGRVGLVFNTNKLSLKSMLEILDKSPVLEKYLELFTDSKKEEVINTLTPIITAEYEKNTLGVRMINTLIHQYFIKGGALTKDEAKVITFQKKMSLKKTGAANG